jgi:hypothetical protein
VLVEEVRKPDGARAWWTAVAAFTTDPTTALGTPGPWQDTIGASSDPRDLAPFVLDMLAHPPGAPHGSVAPPDAVVHPKLLMKTGPFDDPSQIPPDAETLARMAYVLTAPSLLSGEHTGTMFFRHAGGIWEHFILSSPPPKTIEGVARFVANAREPQAEGVAMVLVAIFPGDTPPRPCIQVIAEQAGMVVEIRAPIEYPNGPAGPKEAPRMRMSVPRPVAPEGLFIGVDPDFEFQLLDEGEPN